MRTPDDISALYARLDDLMSAAESGDVAKSVFLSPRELHYAERYLQNRGAAGLAFGGYDGAERKRIYILPEYMEGVKSIAELAEYGFSSEISAVSVSPSGYRQLNHRDYLGSVLGLGIERSVVGDILICDDGKASIICDGGIVRFIVDNLERVANDKVRVREIPIASLCAPEKRFSDISDTVASPRADCIVGALCSLSREKARAAVENGLVEINYEVEPRPDRTVEAPCTVTVRGFGKYELISVNDKTKKGRYRLSARKYL